MEGQTQRHYLSTCEQTFLGTLGPLPKRWPNQSSEQSLPEVPHTASPNREGVCFISNDPPGSHVTQRDTHKEPSPKSILLSLSAVLGCQKRRCVENCGS